MASTRLLPLLLCGAAALRQQPEALFTDSKASEATQACAEPPQFLEEDLPDTSLNLERREGLETDGEAEFDEYMYNLSHVRKCDTIKDFVNFLGVLVVPRLKLAFCYVPKVACSNFKDLINNLNNFPRRTEGFGHDYLISVRWRMHVLKDQISKENGWTFATFLRDPALRYLSAFGSTCVAKDDKGNFEHKFECCGPTVQNNGISKKQFVRHFRARLYSDLKDGVVKNDDHWVSQTQILKQCGWQWFKPEHLDFRGYLSGDVNAQVKSMLKLVNYANDTLVDRLFPKEAIAGHRSPIHLPAEDFYSTKVALNAVKKIYEDDYQNFPGVGCAFTDQMERKFKERAAAAKRLNRTTQAKPKPHVPISMPKSLFPAVALPNPFFPFAKPK